MCPSVRLSQAGLYQTAKRRITERPYVIAHGLKFSYGKLPLAYVTPTVQTTVSVWYQGHSYYGRLVELICTLSNGVIFQ